MTEDLARQTVVATATMVPRRMSIANIVSGPAQRPLRVLMYGVDGVGKTTFAAGAEAPVFIGLEDGMGSLTVPRYPEPQTWSDVLDAVDDLTSSKHSYKTLVIDTLDWLEPLCWKQVVGIGKRTRDGKPIENIEDIGYGKGYNNALDEWRLLCSRFDRLRSVRGMQIVLIAHSWIRPFKNPEGEDFDRFEIKLHAKAAGLLREWADAVLFATHETYTHETDSGRVKGISTGARIMYTQRKAAFDAKNRHNLPEVLPLDWQSLTEAIAANQTQPPEVLRTRIAAMLETVKDADLVKRVQRAVTDAVDNASALARVANKLSAQLNITKKEGTS